MILFLSYLDSLFPSNFFLKIIYRVCFKYPFTIHFRIQHVYALLKGQIDTCMNGLVRRNYDREFNFSDFHGV